MQYYSVAYRPLEWALPTFVQPVATTGLGAGVLDLGVRYPEYAGRDPVLGEYATLFALRRHLADTVPTTNGEMVGISHYRRFAVTRRAKALCWNGEAVTPAVLAKLSRDRFLPPWGTILHPHRIKVVPSLLAQYGMNHHTRDLLLLMGVAVDLDVVTDAAVGDWLGGSQLIPAASVGVFPRSWWTTTMMDLERVATVFLAEHALPRDGYQRRAVAFALERLHSLLVHLLVSTWDPARVIAEPEMIVDPSGRFTANSSGDAPPPRELADQTDR